jgi:predicted ABC-type sugar transport system permease subunit
MTIATGGGASAIAAAIGTGASIALHTSGFLATLFTISIGCVPLVALLALALYAAAWYAQERLALGQYIFAVAQNRRAVVEAGVPVNHLLMFLACLRFAVACRRLAGLRLGVRSTLACIFILLRSTHFGVSGKLDAKIGQTKRRWHDVRNFGPWSPGPRRSVARLDRIELSNDEERFAPARIGSRPLDEFQR